MLTSSPTGGRKRLPGALSALLTVVGAAACAAGACNSGAAAPPTGPPFDAERAWRDMERVVGIGPRPSGSARLEKLREYLEAELRAAGLEPVREAFRAATPIGDVSFANLYADLQGKSADGTPPRLVILCAHIDTKRLPFHFVGANDAGSGTAVLLELARALAGAGPRPVTYRFLFLDGEESIRPEWDGTDNTYGSRHHAARLAAEGQVERVAACVLVDMVGDKDLRLTFDRNSTPALQTLFIEAARRIGLGRHVGAEPQWMLDDHLSFLDVGIDSVDLIDFEYGPDNAWWHTAEDTLERCSRESLLAVGRIVLAGLADLEAQLAR